MVRPAIVTLASGLNLSLAEQAPESEPAVVLLPGPTDSWRSYERVLDLLPHWILAIAVSQRGHGDSDKPDTRYRVEDFASDVVELLNAVQIDRAVLVGHPGSCLIARRVALDRPARVAGRSRGLTDPPVQRRSSPPVRELRHHGVDGSDRPRLREVIRGGHILRERCARGGGQGGGGHPQVPARVWHEMFAGLLDYDDTGELTSVGAPTLLIWGDDDALVPREMQVVLAERMPHAELIVYPAVGHTPRWDDHRQLSRDLSVFVERLQAGP